MSLLVLGSVAVDDIENSHGKRERILGGSASFAAVAASWFTSPEIIGVIGTDFPEAYKSLYREKKIGLDGLEQRQGDTFHWSGKYHDDMIGRDTLETDLGVFEDWKPNLPDSLRQIPDVFLANISPDLQLHVLDQMQSIRLVGLDTMNLWINIAHDDLCKAISRTRVLFVNDEEARLLTGEISLTRAARKLQEMGPEILIIKRGEHGASVHSPDRLFYAPAFPLEKVLDVTGAGDTFAGALMGTLAGQEKLDFPRVCEGVLRGAVLASFCVEDFSLDRLVKVTRDEFDERFKLIRQMIRYE